MPDIFEQVANGDFSDPATQAVADELNAALDALQAQSDENLDRAGVALDNAVGGQAAKEVERLQRELAELQKQAAENREKADAEPVADAAGAGAGGCRDRQDCGPHPAAGAYRVLAQGLAKRNSRRHFHQ